MHPELQSFLEGRSAVSTEQAIWGNGEVHLSIDCYLTGDEAPDELVTSARCVVLAVDAVLVMSEPGANHILPGGRREPGETASEAVVREVREEAGFEIAPLRQLGLLHHHHVTPKPDPYFYPYPDFLQVVYVTRLTEPPVVTVIDDYATSGAFLPVASLSRNCLTSKEWALLKSAIATDN